MPTKGEGAIGALDFTPEERKRLAKQVRQSFAVALAIVQRTLTLLRSLMRRQSVHFKCDACGKVADLLPELRDSSTDDADAKPSKYAAQIAQLHMHSLEPATAPAAASSSTAAATAEATETPSTTSSEAHGDSDESETKQSAPVSSEHSADAHASAPDVAATPNAPSSTTGATATAAAPPQALAPAADPVRPVAVETTTTEAQSTPAAAQAVTRVTSSVDTLLHYFMVACLVALFALLYRKLLKLQGVLQ